MSINPVTCGNLASRPPLEQRHLRLCRRYGPSARIRQTASFPMHRAMRTGSTTGFMRRRTAEFQDCSPTPAWFSAGQFGRAELKAEDAPNRLGVRVVVTSEPHHWQVGKCKVGG